MNRLKLLAAAMLLAAPIACERRYTSASAHRLD